MIRATSLADVWLIEPAVHGDERGFFVETYRDSELAPLLAGARFVQDNQSRSARGVLRGLHYQWREPQGKLVRVARGRIFDVCVDVRPDSASFGQSFCIELDDQSHRQLYIPPGFAHGFLTLSEEADVVYRCTRYYQPAYETGIAWDDPALGLVWPTLEVPYQFNARDAALPRLAEQRRWPR